MFHEIFYWIFNMSIIATITGMFVLLVRGIKKIPRRLTVFLWAIPFLRMVVPVGVNSPYSLMALLSKISTRTIVVYEPVSNVEFSLSNMIQMADSYFPITYKYNVLEPVFEVASLIWMIVSLAILLMLAAMYFTTLHEVKDSTHLRDNIYFSKKVVSPAVYGIVKPRIILPESYQENELVVLHEKTHIQSKDNLLRMIAFGVVALHWFNPFAWLFLKWFLADLEHSCDERVLKKIGEDRAKEYATVLLESGRGTTVFASAFGGARIRTRIENVLSFKRMTGVSLIVFVALIGTIFYVLLTNAG